MESRVSWRGQLVISILFVAIGVTLSIGSPEHWTVGTGAALFFAPGIPLALMEGRARRRGEPGNPLANSRHGLLIAMVVALCMAVGPILFTWPATGGQVWRHPIALLATVGFGGFTVVGLVGMVRRRRGRRHQR